ncbi:hypothetical protein K3495_g16218, partial [Podosphaera aphanis]
MTPLPCLKKNNWFQWFESVENLIFLSQTSAAFLPQLPRNKAIRMWSTWWVAKLRETAPHIRTAPRDNPRAILNEIVSSSQATSFSNVNSIVSRFWTYQPEKNTNLQSFMKEYQKRYQDLREHFQITTEIHFQMHHLLLFHVRKLQPDLANRCRDLSYENTISECLKWTCSSSFRSSGKPKACNFCHIVGHSEDKCRKKMNVHKGKAQEQSRLGLNQGNKNVLSVDRCLEDSSYQLDTAADFHVTGNKSDFSSYSPASQTIHVAGGGKVITSGRGDLNFPTVDGKT